MSNTNCAPGIAAQPKLTAFLAPQSAILVASVPENSLNWSRLVPSITNERTSATGVSGLTGLADRTPPADATGYWKPHATLTRRGRREPSPASRRASTSAAPPPPPFRRSYIIVKSRWKRLVTPGGGDCGQPPAIGRLGR